MAVPTAMIGLLAFQVIKARREEMLGKGWNSYPASVSLYTGMGCGALTAHD
jgi:hypothetical protein